MSFAAALLLAGCTCGDGAGDQVGDYTPTAPTQHTEDTQDTGPPGDWQYTTLHYVVSCGLRLDDTVTCWGVEPPEEVQGLQVAQVEAGWEVVCIRDLNDEIACWDYLQYGAIYGQLETPPGAFTSLTLGTRHGCALDSTGSATCWGDRGTPWQYNIQNIPEVGSFDLLAASHNVCGIRSADQGITCWGGVPEISDEVPEGPFMAVDVALNFACALDLDGEPHCWGALDQAHEPDFQPMPPGPYVALGSGEHNICGLRADGSFDCAGGWGAVDLMRAPADLPPIRQFDFSAPYGCGVTFDDHVVCWGDTTQLGAQPPE